MQASTPYYAVATTLLALFLSACAGSQPAPPPTSYDGSAVSGRLEIRLFAVNDLQSFRQKWLESDHVPDEQSETAVIQGGTVHLPILINGCGAEEASSCEIYGRLTITDMETQEVVYQGNRVRLWSNQEPAAEGVWSMATHVPNVTVREGGNPMRIEFEVEDHVWEESVHAGLILRTTGTVNDTK